MWENSTDSDWQADRQQYYTGIRYVLWRPVYFDGIYNGVKNKHDHVGVSVSSVPCTRSYYVFYVYRVQGVFPGGLVNPWSRGSSAQSEYRRYIVES